MKYKDVEVGIPTKEMVDMYIQRKKLPFTADDFFNYWQNKKWKTQKGLPLKSLEAAMSAYDSVFYYSREQYKRKAKPDVFIPYSEQLKMPQWKEYRDRVFRKRGYRCELCGSDKNINVHHTFYDPKCYAWDYDIRDVRVLCAKCHEKHHKISSLFKD